MKILNFSLLNENWGAFMQLSHTWFKAKRRKHFSDNINCGTHCHRMVDKAKYINRLKGETRNSQKIGLSVAMKYKEPDKVSKSLDSH